MDDKYEKDQIEVWKGILGYEGCYIVSSKGRVKSLERRVKNGVGYITVRERILRPSYSNDRGNKDYLQVVLHKNREQKMFRVHQLVAEHFVRKPITNKRLEVHHKNEIKDDNDFRNLEWVTHRENIRLSFRNGVRRSTSKPVAQSDLKGNQIAVYPSISEASRQTGIDYSQISKCCIRKYGFKSAGGFNWDYME
ncbi:hypothetical protein ES705_25601 [subsurface metagenome]